MTQKKGAFYYEKKINIHYAWVVLLICFAALLAVQGIRLSFGAFMKPWEKEFAIDRGTVSLVSGEYQISQQP